MANSNDVLIIKEIFSKGSSVEHSNGIMGTLAVIKYLYKREGAVTSKQISDELHVSSARMTVLLKKLEKDNIIVKEPSKEDARAINIKLTEHGIKKSKEIEESFHLCIEKLLDIFGLEELTKLLNNMGILRDVFKENLKIDLKENNK